MKSQVILISIISLLIYSGCKDSFICKLTEEDKMYLYENEEVIKFLENGTDTITLTAETCFNIFDQTSATGLPDLDKEETGSSILVFNNSYRLGIHVTACWESLRFSLYQTNEEGHDFIFSERILRDSVLTLPITVLNHEFSDCLLLSQKDSTKVIKSLYYNQENRLLKIVGFDNYTLELIPEK